MKKLILWLRNYWYIVLVVILFFNFICYTIYPVFKLYHARSNELSMKGLLFEVVSKKDSVSPHSVDYLLAPGIKLRPYVDSLSISGHTYTSKNKEFKLFFQKLATNEEFQQQFQHYHLEDLSNEDLREITQYRNKLKLFDKSKIKDDKEEKALMDKLQLVFQKSEIKLTLTHSSAPLDSTIVITMNKKMVSDYQENSIFNTVYMCILFCFTLVLILSYFILLSHIALRRRLWYVELALSIIFLIPHSYLDTNLGSFPLLILFKFICLTALFLVFCFNTPTRLSYNKIWYFLLVAYLAIAVVLKAYHLSATWYYSLIITLLLISWQLKKLKGLKKRVMWKWISISLQPLLVLLISFVAYFVLFACIYELAGLIIIDSVGSKYVTGHLYLEYLCGTMFSITTLLCLLFPFLAVLSALTEFSIRYYNAIQKWIVALMVFSSYIFVITFGINSQNRTFKNDIVTIYFIISLGLIFTYLIMRVYRYFDAVRHNERKHLRSLLEGSFGISTIDEYFAYYQEVILKLYPKTQIAFISGDVTINDNDNLKLPSLEVVQAIPDTNYFNLDIAIIDGEAISEVFPVLDAPPRKSKKGSNVSQSHEVHLYFPLYNSEHQHLGYLLFGESGKLYWDKENADFLYETVQLFQSFLSSLLLQTQYRNEQLKLEREKQERIFEHQIAIERELRAQELEEANRRMTDSISYAALIQQSILPNESILTNYLDNYFLLWKPHDVVGGDFFWFCPIPNSKSFLLAMVDCTGHGVPGAFMTIMTNSILNSIVRDRNVYDPAEIIKMLHKEVQYTLQQGHKGSMNDGLDISLILLDPTQQKIGFAGAKHRILHWDATLPENTLAVYRGGRHSVGGIRPELDISLQEINYHSGDMIYLFTDGLIDQPISLDKGIKRMTYNGWYEYFSTLVNLGVEEQNATLVSKVNEMLVIHEQIDDITVLGIRL